jgi:hypothetical protein
MRQNDCGTLNTALGLLIDNFILQLYHSYKVMSHVETLMIKCKHAAAETVDNIAASETGIKNVRGQGVCEKIALRQ